jgi:hypothetical protein
MNIENKSSTSRLYAAVRLFAHHHPDMTRRKVSEFPLRELFRHRTIVD